VAREGFLKEICGLQDKKFEHHWITIGTLNATMHFYWTWDTYNCSFVQSFLYFWNIGAKSGSAGVHCTLQFLAWCVALTLIFHFLIGQFFVNKYSRICLHQPWLWRQFTYNDVFSL